MPPYILLYCRHRDTILLLSSILANISTENMLITYYFNFCHYHDHNIFVSIMIHNIIGQFIGDIL